MTFGRLWITLFKWIRQKNFFDHHPLFRQISHIGLRCKSANKLQKMIRIQFKKWFTIYKWGLVIYWTFSYDYIIYMLIVTNLHCMSWKKFWIVKRHVMRVLALFIYDCAIIYSKFVKIWANINKLINFFK